MADEERIVTLFNTVFLVFFGFVILFGLVGRCAVSLFFCPLKADSRLTLGLHFLLGR